MADNNTATRFYPGGPTTNILSNTADFNNWTSARNSGSYPTVTANTSANPLGKSYGGMADKVYIPEDGTYPRLQQYFTPSSTNTHTFSVWIRSLSGDCDCFLGAFRNSPWSLPGYSVKSITSEWQRFTFSWTPPDTTTHVIYMGSHDTAAQKGNTLEFWGAQMENNNNSTPYTPGSRSSTESLIDLKKTTNIDVSNVSFDSTGQPDLDGTGDYFQSTTSCGITGDITLEAVFNEDAASAPHTTVICTDTDHQKGVKLMSFKNTNRYGLWLGFGTSSYVAMVAGTLNNDTKYHLVGTWKQSTGVVKVYLNGVLQQTISTNQTASVVLNTGRISTGVDYHSFSYGLNGQVYVGRVYDKVITDEEVKQNYNVYKNRFGI